MAIDHTVNVPPQPSIHLFTSLSHPLNPLFQDGNSPHKVHAVIQPIPTPDRPSPMRLGDARLVGSDLAYAW